jgi:hypothetical protein
MNDFKTYYTYDFRKDINQFFSTIPEKSVFHEDPDNKQIFSIQYERLTPLEKHLDFLDKETKEIFGVALYFTILTDMVCFTHYKNNYKQFEQLTRYPKFIGNCPGACHLKIDPREIFWAMNKGINLNDEHLMFRKIFEESKSFMRAETIGFFESYIPNINGSEFWNKCENEFPFMMP